MTDKRTFILQEMSKLYTMFCLPGISQNTETKEIKIEYVWQSDEAMQLFETLGEILKIENVALLEQQYAQHGLDAILEPIKKRMYDILRNPRNRVVRIHVSSYFGWRLRAAGETFHNPVRDGAEYHLLGYPCEVHHEKFVYAWAVEYQTMVDLSPEKAELKTVLSSDAEEEWQSM